MKKLRCSEQVMNSTSKSVIAILSEWDKDVAAEIIVKQKLLSSRRMFLGQSMGLIGAVALSPCVSAKTKAGYAVPDSSTQPWLTLAEVQEHLFPRTAEIKNSKANNKFSPGAKDIHAINYLYTMLHTPDADVDERKFIIKGVSWLDGIANTMAGANFLKLNRGNRERVLRKISESDTGETWLSTLLRYIFEALLTDPVYGGNTNSMGWQWLEHQPGFPRPPENKKYWLLAEKDLQTPSSARTGKAK